MQSVSIVTNFDFTGYDTLYVSNTVYQAKVRDNEAAMREFALKYLQKTFQEELERTGLFSNVVTQAEAIKPGSRVLTMVNTIVEYEKGGGGARYFAGIYGAGQPILRVNGKILDGPVQKFEFIARRSGDSGSARMFGGFRSDEDIQREDILDLSRDLAAFIRQTSLHNFNK